MEEKTPLNEAEGQLSFREDLALDAAVKWAPAREY